MLAIKHFIFFKLLLLGLLAGSSPANAEKLDYLGANSVEADRNVRKIISEDPAKLDTDAEKAAWSRALLSAVALHRLEGEDAEALSLLNTCSDYCSRYGAEADWRAEMNWACTKKKETKFCLPPNIKAQKPSH